VPTTAPQISARHRANRLEVVGDMAAFLLQHHAAVGPYAAVVDAALSFACGLDDGQWAAIGVLTGHYANGSTPDPDTTAAVLARLESMLPTPVTAGPTFEGIA
jgi:hypothetical protein